MRESVPNADKARELIPAYRDTFVHYLFGSPGHEAILLHFLNSVLESDGQQSAQSVEIRNPFNPATFVTDKFTILDIKATDGRGDIFAVEFQTSERASFANRMTYNTCKSFSQQMSSGEEYSTIKTVIGIAVVTFEMFWQLRGIHNSFRLTAKADSRVVFTEQLQMHVIEAAEEKIDRAGELPSALRAWVNFIHYSHLKTEAEMTILLQEQPMVGLAYEKFRQFNNDERMRALDDAHQRFLHDLATDIEEAHGRGEAKKAVEIARNMKGKGYSVSDITDLTGLSDAEIERL
jgi:predicted transposase/invertase (TIGR01784 family)